MVENLRTIYVTITRKKNPSTGEKDIKWNILDKLINERLIFDSKFEALDFLKNNYEDVNVLVHHTDGRFSYSLTLDNHAIASKVQFSKGVTEESKKDLLQEIDDFFVAHDGIEETLKKNGNASDDHEDWQDDTVEIELARRDAHNQKPVEILAGDIEGAEIITDPTGRTQQKYLFLPIDEVEDGNSFIYVSQKLKVREFVINENGETEEQERVFVISTNKLTKDYKKISILFNRAMQLHELRHRNVKVNTSSTTNQQTNHYSLSDLILMKEKLARTPGTKTPYQRNIDDLTPEEKIKLIGHDKSRSLNAETQNPKIAENTRFFVAQEKIRDSTNQEHLAWRKVVRKVIKIS